MFSDNGIHRILIVGGAGYIGNSLVNVLSPNYTVYVVDNFSVNTQYKVEINSKLLSKGKINALLKCDAGVPYEYVKYLEKCDLIVYLASLNSVNESKIKMQQYFENNILQSYDFLNALSKNALFLKKIILTSSRSIYGEMKKGNGSNEKDIPCPNSVYGVTKLLQERLFFDYCKNSGIHLDIFRIFNVFGENQEKFYNHIGVIPKLYESIKNKGAVFLNGSGKIMRDYIYIGDVLKIMKQSISKNLNENPCQEIYNLGTGKGFTLLEVATTFKKVLSKNFTINLVKENDDIMYSIAYTDKLISTFKYSFPSLLVDEFIMRYYSD